MVLPGYRHRRTIRFETRPREVSPWKGTETRLSRPPKERKDYITPSQSRPISAEADHPPTPVLEVGQILSMSQVTVRPTTQPNMTSPTLRSPTSAALSSGRPVRTAE